MRIPEGMPERVLGRIVGLIATKILALVQILGRIPEPRRNDFWKYFRKEFQKEPLGRILVKLWKVKRKICKNLLKIYGRCSFEKL